MTGAPLQKFLRSDHQKTTEIYAGHIETETKKQTDFLNDFWKGKLNETKGAASIGGEKIKRILLTNCYCMKNGISQPLFGKRSTRWTF